MFTQGGEEDVSRLWTWAVAKFCPHGDDLRNGVRSLLAGASDDREAVFYQRILDSFDFSAIAALRAKYRKFDASLLKSWFDLSRHLPTAYRVVRRLKLDRSEPLNIFDIACGVSYFGYICRSYGHEVIGVDKPNAILEDLNRLFGIRLIAEPIKAGEPLPPTPRVKLITALRSSFHTRPERLLWGLEDWKFFFDDLILNHLHPGGRIYLQMHEQSDRTGLHLGDPAFVDFVESQGGQVTGHLITFGMHEDDLKAKEAMSRLQEALRELYALVFRYTVKDSKPSRKAG
jgi:hypothetical protein